MTENYHQVYNDKNSVKHIFRFVLTNDKSDIYDKYDYKSVKLNLLFKFPGCLSNMLLDIKNIICYSKSSRVTLIVLTLYPGAPRFPSSPRGPGGPRGPSTPGLPGNPGSPVSPFRPGRVIESPDSPFKPFWPSLPG